MSIARAASGPGGSSLPRVVAGNCVIDLSIVSTLLRQRLRQGPLDTLSDRERAVLALMAEGRTNRAIADDLGFSVKTVEARVRAILDKLHLHESPHDNRRVLAVLQYLRP